MNMQSKKVSVLIGLIVGILSSWLVLKSGLLMKSDVLWWDPCAEEQARAEVSNKENPQKLPRMVDCFSDGIPSIWGFLVSLGVGITTGMWAGILHRRLSNE
ncbi:MAG: hypothetical protein Q7S48_01545 [bacterium]|nr:hypothetical protein [bacterium]